MPKQISEPHRNTTAEQKPDGATMAAEAEAHDTARAAALAGDTSQEAQDKRAMVTPTQVDYLRRNFAPRQGAPSPGLTAANRARELALDLGLFVLDASRPCREQSLAVTKLEEAILWFEESLRRPAL